MSADSKLAADIEGLLRAKGWETRTQGFAITTVEPSLDEPTHVWLAGPANQLLYDVIRNAGATRLIVEDQITGLDRDRLSKAPGSPLIISRSRFLDRLWNASAAADFGRRDGEVPDIDYGNGLEFEEDPYQRHVDQTLHIGGQDIPDHRLIRHAVSYPGNKAAILADAGYGKSELLKLLSWGSAVRYMSAASAGDEPGLPPVAVRVHLRGMRAFDLDSIAGRLREETARSRNRQGVQIENGQVLRHLMMLDRIILLLDGLDELQVSREELERGLRSVERVVLEGGRLVVTSRAGHFLSAASIRDRFEEFEIAGIPSLNEGDARRLLANYGAKPSEADSVVYALGPTSPASGIPLFLLLALSAKLYEPVDAHIAESRTRVLLLLIERFCERDEPRIGLPSDVQLRMLTELAYWISIEGPLEAASALEVIGLEPGDIGAGLVTHPHALLMRRSDGRVECKFPEVQALLAAKSNVESARSGDWSSVLRDWRGVRLDAMTTEYLARLISEVEIQSLWSGVAQGASSRTSGLARRNVLGVALAKLEDLADSDAMATRSRTLETLLGSKNLSSTQLNGISLERLDLSGWDLRSLEGQGGAIRFCNGLAHAFTDESLLTLDAVEGCDVESNVAEVERLRAEKGIEVLSNMLRSWVERRGPTERLLPRRSVADAGFSNQWATMRRRGFATMQRREGGTRFWIVDADQLGLLTSFATEPDADKRRRLCESNSDLLGLTIELGK